MNKPILLTFSHLLFAALGFALGIYMLPILTAPDAPSADEVTAAASGAEFQAEFRRDLPGSDFLHWGEGKVMIGREAIVLQGEVAPGPDYKLYLSPKYVETEAEFEQAKPRMVQVGDVKTFKNFVIPVPETIDPKAFNTVVV
ncbi:MAG: DM13 domain-containing protein, partial [Candidatus Thiodiazotropha sp. (ex Notomyrtea botanica)]|nr:DM13 domain-containing protein [Candidatus Thiodiazotropha sp. (ex Notomyrtea botanica)]